MNNKFIFFDELVIPIDNLLYMRKLNDDVWEVICSGTTDEKRTQRFVVSDISVMNLRKLTYRSEEKEKRICELEEKVKLLQTHISLMPGGTEYLLAEKDFHKNI